MSPVLHFPAAHQPLCTPCGGNHQHTAVTNACKKQFHTCLQVQEKAQLMYTLMMIDEE